MPDINYEMTAEEEEFFKTGVVPKAADVTDPVVEDPVVDPVVEPVVEPDPVKSTAADPNVYLERMLGEERARAAEMQAKLKTMQDQLAAINKPKAPDMETDPVGYLTFQMKEMQDAIKALSEGTATKSAEQEQTQARDAFLNNVNSAINDFKKTHDDYDAAYKHLRTTRESDLAEAGYTKNEIFERLNREEFDVALRAVQTGKSPAEVAYAMAKRAGYASAKLDGTPKIDQIRKGLEAAKGVPSGGTPKTDVTLDSLKTASNADINDMVENNWDKIFGRSNSKSIF